MVLIPAFWVLVVLIQISHISDTDVQKLQFCITSEYMSGTEAVRNTYYVLDLNIFACVRSEDTT